MSNYHELTAIAQKLGDIHRATVMANEGHSALCGEVAGVRNELADIATAVRGLTEAIAPQPRRRGLWRRRGVSK